MYTLQNYLTNRPPASMLSTEKLRKGDKLFEFVGDDLMAIYEADETTRQALDQHLRLINELGQQAAKKPAAKAPTPAKAAPAKKAGRDTGRTTPAAWKVGDRVRISTKQKRDWIIDGNQEEMKGKTGTVSRTENRKTMWNGKVRYDWAYYVSFDGETQPYRSGWSAEQLEAIEEAAPAPKVQATPKFKRGGEVGTPEGYGKVVAVRGTDDGEGFEYDVKMKGKGSRVVTSPEAQLRVSDEIKIDESRKPRKEKAPAAPRVSKARAAKPKKPAPAGVAHLDEDVRVIRSYVRFHGRDLPVSRLESLLKLIQRKIREEFITKKSRFGQEVMGVQESLLQVCNNHQADEVVRIEIGPTEDLAKLTAIAGGERVFPTLTALKGFISKQGKKLTKEDLLKLYERLERALAKGGEEDPFAGHIGKAMQYVEDALKRKSTMFSFSKQGLAGVDVLGALLAGIDRHTRKLSKHADSCGCKKTKRSTSLSGCGCRG